MKRIAFLSTLLFTTLAAMAQQTIVVETPGTLRNMLTTTDVSDLTIRGSIDGSDVALLRKMASEGGSLRHLDLSAAHIVAGGDAYYHTGIVPPKGMEHNALELSHLIGMGWNLGNSLEVPTASDMSELDWGNPYTTQEFIDFVKASGFNAVRIPVSWYVHTTDGTNNLKPGFVNRVKEVVDYCYDNGLYVIVNCHFDNNWLQTKGFTDLSETNVTKVAQKQYDLWHQIAETFSNYDERLIFAGTNEPGMNSGVSYSTKAQAALDRYLQAFVDAVRETGGNNLWRTLIVQSWGAEIPPALNNSGALPIDPTPGRIMMEVHCYDPNLFGLFDTDQSWGKMYYYWGAGNHNPNSVLRNAPLDKEYEYLDASMESLYQRYGRRGIPVVLGEYAANLRKLDESENQELHDKSVADWYYYITRSMLRRGLLPFTWDSGKTRRPIMGIFNRAKRTIVNEVAYDAIMRAVTEAGVPLATPETVGAVLDGLTTAEGVVGRSMWRDCSVLESLVLPADVARIESRAFEGCTSLRNLTVVSGSVPVAAFDAFADDLTDCTVKVAQPVLSSFQGHNVWKTLNLEGLPVSATATIDRVDLPASARLADYITDTPSYSLADGALVALPSQHQISSLTVTGALNGDDYRLLEEMAGTDVLGKTTSGQLRSLDLSATTVVEGGSSYAVDQTDGTRYFTVADEFPAQSFGKSQLQQIALPATTPVVGAGALSNSMVQDVTFGEETKIIGEGALSYLSSLSSLNLPNNLTTVAANAFSTLPAAVSEVVIPYDVRTIGERAFAMGNFTTLHLSHELQTVEAQAFRGCTSLTSIYAYAVIPPTCAADAFRWVEKGSVTLYVPKGTLDAYKSAAVWQDFNVVEWNYDGISDATLSTDAPVEYYDLQGRPTTHGVGHVVIVRRGDKTAVRQMR